MPRAALLLLFSGRLPIHPSAQRPHPSVRPRVGLGRHVRDVRLRRASGRRRGEQLSGGKNARTEILACTFAAPSLVRKGTTGPRGRSHKFNRGDRSIGASSEFGHVGQASRKEPLRKYMDGVRVCLPQQTAPRSKSAGAEIPRRMERRRRERKPLDWKKVGPPQITSKCGRHDHRDHRPTPSPRGAEKDSCATVAKIRPCFAHSGFDGVRKNIESTPGICAIERASERVAETLLVP